jgi:hypothetical protein
MVSKNFKNSRDAIIDTFIFYIFFYQFWVLQKVDPENDGVHVSS